MMIAQQNPRPTVRRVGPQGDISNIARIKGDTSDGVYTNMLPYARRVSETVIVESGGLAVAYAIWRDDVWTDEPGEPMRSRTLTDVHVHEDYRRAGFGRLAVEGVAWILLGDAKAGWHPDRMLMASVPTRNVAGRDFLESTGFSHAGNVYYPGAGMARMDHDFYYRDLEQFPPTLESLPEGMAAPVPRPEHWRWS